ncbi:MAG: acyl-CoA dehydrogenase family protein, partial [Candidatus Aenigmarchaeota archaeon]|nr:acyl-CoA dehydrogenase family protein [Candidatus Aenigmarchaeota archaeon]
DSGSDLGSLKSYSEKKGNKYHLNGSKIFVTNGGIAHVYTTLVLSDKEKGKKGGMGCFIVEKSSPGFKVVRIEEKMGLKASPTAQLAYDNCEIPEENLMGENGKGFAHTLSMLCGSRTCIGAQATGIAQAAYEKALKYSKERKHFPMAASEAKLFGSEASVRICEEAIQIHGGYGYIKEYDVERHYRDARVTTIYEGTSEVHRLIISKAAIDSAK